MNWGHALRFPMVLLGATLLFVAEMFLRLGMFIMSAELVAGFYIFHYCDEWMVSAHKKKGGRFLSFKTAATHAGSILADQTRAVAEKFKLCEECGDILPANNHKTPHAGKCCRCSHVETAGEVHL